MTRETSMADAPPPQDYFEEAWENCSRQIRERLREAAEREAGSQEVDRPAAYHVLNDFFRAAMSDKRKSPVAKVRETTRGLFGWLDENLFLMILVFMTLVFGYLGWGVVGGEADGSGAEKASVQQSKAFLDIAKVFAGAIVGSAASRSIARRKPSG